MRNRFEVANDGRVKAVFAMKPRAQQRLRYTKSGVGYKSESQRNNETCFRDILFDMLQANTDFERFGAGRCLMVDLCFEFKIPNTRKVELKERAVIWHPGRPDTDNLVKFVLDCCNGILWEDDSQCVIVNACKRYGWDDAITLKITEVQN